MRGLKTSRTSVRHHLYAYNSIQIEGWYEQKNICLADENEGCI